MASEASSTIDEASLGVSLSTAIPLEAVFLGLKASSSMAVALAFVVVRGCVVMIAFATLEVVALAFLEVAWLRARTLEAFFLIVEANERIVKT